MAAPALQKTWQGGSTGGGTEFINALVSGTSPRDTLWEMHKAMSGFNASPWTVVGSSDSSVAAMDATDRLVAPSDWVYHAPGAPRAWLVLQQAAVGATFQALIWIDDTTADPDGENINVVCNAGGFGSANGGADGSTTVLPTPSDPTKNFSIDGSDWLGAEGGSPTQKVLTCISSTDGECFRVVVSQQSTGKPIANFGIEVPRLPPSTWTTPVVGYLFKSTVASGLSCFGWLIMANAITNGEIVANVDRVDSTGFSQVTMVPQMPMTGSLEVMYLQEDDRPNPMLYPCALFGYDVGVRSTESSHGSLFDWYWCSRHTSGKHLLDLDTIPLAGDRTFVCVGDCVWGWLNDSATDLSYT